MKRRTFLKGVTFAAGMGFVGLAYGFESSFLDISRQAVTVHGLDRPVKVVAVSDLHLPSISFSCEDLIGVVNRESPDIFVLAGDIIDARGGEDRFSVFAGVKAGKKIAVLGNREYYRRLNLARLAAAGREAGVALLVNEAEETSGVILVGLDDLIYGRPDYAMLDYVRAQKLPTMAVCHCPATFDAVTPLPGRQLVVLAGHTHGGQIAPLGYALITPVGSGRYVRGWYGDSSRKMYVMRGVGTAVVPVRIGARPEVLVLSLEPG